MDKLADITAQGWIMAYFIRSDGERFLLGTGAYDFKSDLQHFQPNAMANDIVELQGTDGQLLAGQVRRSATQSFDGYVGDSTQNRERIEELRRDFLMFFRKNFFYKTVYIYPNGTAIQRKRGYLVDAPSVPELYQFFPEYHVALNYEDPNYYEYAEDAQGDETFANILEISIAQALSGGLIWDADGAVSHGYVWSNPQTASGSSFQITGIEGAPLTLTELKGNATQNGTPTPTAPVAVNTTTGENVVKIEGKNLFDKDSAVAGLINRENGQIWTTSSYMTSDYIKVEAGQTYTSTGFNNWYRAGFNAQKQWTSLLSESDTFTIPNGVSFIRMSVSNADLNSAQFELGSTATTYEPYQGQEFEVNLGKNLFDKSTASQNYRLGSTGDPFADDEYYLSDYISVAQNTAYYISGTSGTPASSAICFYASDKSFISRRAFVSDWYTFTTPANTAFLRFTTLKTNSIDQVQLELGSQASSYAPYFTPIELAKIGTYQDRIYKTDGKWYVEKQVGKVLVGSSPISGNASRGNAQSNTESALFYYGRLPDSTTTVQETSAFTLCDRLVPQNVYSPANTSNGYYIAANNHTLAIRLRGDVIGSSMTLGDAKTWLGNNPLTIYYALATPTTTEITNETLLAQLNFIANLYGGTNNIMLVGTGAQGEIEVEYMTEVDVDGAGYEWEAGGDGGETTITLDAVEAVRPVWAVTGPATDPTLTNITTGETIAFTGTVPAGQTLTVDMDARTATMAGANVFQYITGDWLRLEPGNNRMSYTATGTTELSTLSWNGVVG